MVDSHSSATMALEIDEQEVTMEDSSNGIRETNSKENEKDCIDNRNDWIAPDRVLRPTLFSGGGEDPLAQLDLYCRSHSDTRDTKVGGNSVNDTSTVSDVDALLSVAEFLFGQKALNAALAIVDSRRSLVTKLVAPSGRFVHTIRSSSASNSLSTMAAMDTSNGRNSIDGEHYLCLLSPSQSSRFLAPIRYCSCRSFLEKSTRKVAALSSHRIRGTTGNNKHGIDDENFHDGPPVCKHLLALSLLPHLVAASGASGASDSYNRNSYNYSYPEIKCITEKEFASVMLDRIM